MIRIINVGGAGIIKLTKSEEEVSGGENKKVGER